MDALRWLLSLRTFAAASRTALASGEVLDLSPPPDKRQRLVFKVKTRGRTRHWDRCINCDASFAFGRPARRWYGLCLRCYRQVPPDDLPFYNNITQRWRKAAMRDFGKHDTDSLPVWTSDPSPIQVMLLRLAHVFGLTTPPGCEGTLCEGLDRRLGATPEAIDAAIRGRAELTPESRSRLVKGAIDWLAADEAHCLAMAELYPDDEDEVDPDDPEVLAVAAELRRALGRAG